MKLYPLYLDIGSYEDQRYILLGVFDTEEKSVTEKGKLESLVKEKLEAGRPDGIVYDEGGYPGDNTSEEDFRKYFDWSDSKYDLEQINRFYLDEPFDLNQLTKL